MRKNKIALSGFIMIFAAIPLRIISLGPTVTEEIYLLGAEDCLVGCTTYCQRPEGAKKKEKVGNVVEVSVEKIVSLKPDVVLASSLTNRRAISKLEKLGIKVVSFTQAKDFAEICDQFLSLGKIIGKEKKAEEILVSAKKDADRIKQKVQGLSHPKIFVVLGVKPLFTVTKDSFINDLIEMAGGVNITREARSGCYSREEVVRLNPDIIIITTMGLAGKEEESAWRRFGTLSAVKNNRIYVIDSYLICSPTPVSFVQVLKKMVQIFHPELGQL